ncbi:transposase [Streptomyces sp. NPDC088246]|uniref:transposase n=1 Tax=Streptomyces sp. NPDC088246 TaxID=3365842 RepID=UPI0038309867
MPHLGSTVYLRALAAAALSSRPAATPRRTAPAERVVIVSASIGAGHDGAAHELHRRLRAAGVTVDRYDLLDLLPARIGRTVRDGYHRMLVRAPWVYQRIYSSTERAGGGGPLARALLRTAEDRMLRALPADTGAVVSTYPGASRVLGRLRLAGRLDVPVFTYLTDFSVHPLWVADGVDVHLAAHAVPAAQARALGAGDVRVGGPVVDPRFRPAQDAERSAARARFGLPATAPLALLVAGSWGVGPVRQVALELQGCGAAVPVVVCGRNEALARQLREDGIEHAYGWVDDMPGLMHAADVLVQNAGGLTSLEAFTAGLPVASYRCIPGHGPANAAALDEAGVAAWIQDAAELKNVLCDLIDGPDNPAKTLQAEQEHRHHAVVEQVIADSKASALAHLPSGHFHANAAWLTLWAMTYNLLRATGTLASAFHAKATTATLRTHLVQVSARIARSARRITLHLPHNWPLQEAWTRLFDAVHDPPALAPA